MRHAAAVGVVVVALVGAASAQDGPAPVQRETDGEATVAHRLFAAALARDLGLRGPPRLRAVRWRDPRPGDVVARGVQVRLGDLDVERVEARDVAWACAWARRVADATPGAVVEARGRHVLVLRGAPLAGVAFAVRARRAGWAVLPAPRRSSFYRGPEEVLVRPPEVGEVDPLDVGARVQVEKGDPGVSALMLEAMGGGGPEARPEAPPRGPVTAPR